LLIAAIVHHPVENRYKSMAELQKLFDSVPAVNGKKAPAFVEKVLSMAVEF